MFHHTAFATREPAATHAFYTEAMGFELVKVEVAPTPKGGWAKHFFYDTGGGELMASWDLHDHQALHRRRPPRRRAPLRRPEPTGDAAARGEVLPSAGPHGRLHVASLLPGFWP